MQGGVRDIGMDGTGASVAITFPTAFSAVPLPPQLTIANDGHTGEVSPVPGTTVYVENTSETGFTITVIAPTTITGTIKVSWLAVGPE
jgi:hypothetical protein